MRWRYHDEGPVPPMQQAYIVRVAQDNNWELTTTELAERFGLDNHTIIHILRRHGVVAEHILGSKFNTKSFAKDVEMALQRLGIGGGYGSNILCDVDTAITARPKRRTK